MKNVKGENPLKQEIKTIQGRKRWTKLLSCSKKKKTVIQYVDLLLYTWIITIYRRE